MLAAISVAISTRLPMLPNLIICTSIYVLGHLVPLLVQSTLERFELVQFIGQLLATILPNRGALQYLCRRLPARGRSAAVVLGWAGLCT